MTDFSGHWEGVWIREGCTETGIAIGGFCRLNEANRLVFDVAQTGDHVIGSVSVAVSPTGLLFAVPVTGTVIHNPDQLRLTGSLSTVGGVLSLDRLDASMSHDTFHQDVVLLGGSLGLTITAPASVGTGAAVMAGPFTRVRQ